MNAAHVFEVTAADFQELVQRSQEVPILLDFWADWCGPCKTLTPILEKLAAEYGGAFAVGKVDIEQERELAQAFRVQSIPFGVLIAGGRPVDAFQGAIPERELRAFLARAGIEPAASAPAAAEPDSPEAKLQAAVRAAAAGDAAAARAALGAIDDDSELRARRDRVLDGLAWLEADLESVTAPAAVALRRGRAALLDGRSEQAMQEILESLESDPAYGEQLGRRAMLLCFAVVGEDSDLAGDFRRRMATLLY